MKKCLSVIAVLLMLSLLGSVTALAEVTPLEAPDEQVITLSELEAGESLDSDSYTVVDDGEPILIVTHAQAPGLTAALSDATDNGFYMVDFLLPDGQTEVFLTGLTRNNVDEIEQEIVNSYSSGSFALTDLDFIDTEKTRDVDGDDNLCWAAAASNLLTYTGWAAQVGFDSTDDLFELYIDSFENKGGHPYYAIGWFFNGTKNTNPTSAVPIGHPYSGGYLTDYAFDEVARTVPIQQDGAQGMKQLYDALRDGCGAALDLNLFKGSADEGGHSVTCWGFVTDKRYPDTDKVHYQSVIITDSDSDELRNADRRDAPNIMSCYPLTSFVQGTSDTYSFSLINGQTAVVSDGVILRPYSPEIPYETISGATHSRTSTADLLFDKIFLSTAPDIEETTTKYAVGSKIYFIPYFLNIGEKTYSGNFTFKAVVTDAAGKQWYTRTVNAGNQSIAANRIIHFSNTFQITKSLPAGDYRFTIEINPSRTVKEAYYYNNVKTIDFKVRETYMLGDLDNDGDLTVIDVTKMQRILVDIDADLRDSNALRGDVNGSGDLDILDVTLLQRHLVNIAVKYPIGETRMYD